MELSEGAELCFPLLLNISCRKPMPSQYNGLLLDILLFFTSMITAALNLLVIISISHFRELHTSTNLVILSLAFSDFLVGLLLMPGQILLTEACWFLGELMCALFQYADYVITASSVGNMLLISLDRYLAICHPLRYTTGVTLKRTKVCICLFWICSLLYSLVILYEFLRQPFSQNSCYGECVMIHTVITGPVDFVITIVGPVTVIIVLHARIFVVAVSQAQAIRSHVAQQHSMGVTAKKSEMKAARTLGVVVISFLICLVPYYYAMFNEQKTLILETWLFYCNSCLNPVIYASFYPWFRKSIKLIATCKILQPNSCDTKIV